VSRVSFVALNALAALRAARSLNKQRSHFDRLLRQIVAQLAATAGVTKPTERLGFDLADTLAGYAELLADFF
jgi:hypothetical protein